MAFIHGKDSVVLHGVYPLTAYLNSASASQDVEVAETTAFGASAKTFVTGLRAGAVSASGMFDGDANATDEVLAASIGSDTLAPVTVGPNGVGIGSRVIILQAKTTSYEVSSPVGDVVAVTYAAQADGGVDGGISLASLASVSSSTNHASQDNSASSSNGGIAQLHVTANTRSAACDFKVQHSADNSTWADLTTFTQVASSSTTSERETVAAATTVNRYLRAVSTLTAGSGAVTYQISFARR
jgi:hypothetical protein